MRTEFHQILRKCFLCIIMTFWIFSDFLTIGRPFSGPTFLFQILQSFFRFRHLKKQLPLNGIAWNFEKTFPIYWLQSLPNFRRKDPTEGYYQVWIIILKILDFWTHGSTLQKPTLTHSNHTKFWDNASKASIILSAKFQS